MSAIRVRVDTDTDATTDPLHELATIAVGLEYRAPDVMAPVRHGRAPGAQIRLTRDRSASGRTARPPARAQAAGEYVRRSQTASHPRRGPRDRAGRSLPRRAAHRRQQRESTALGGRGTRADRQPQRPPTATGRTVHEGQARRGAQARTVPPSLRRGGCRAGRPRDHRVVQELRVGVSPAVNHLGGRVTRPCDATV
jgi:hypothetical protein